MNGHRKREFLFRIRYKVEGDLTTYRKWFETVGVPEVGILAHFNDVVLGYFTTGMIDLAYYEITKIICLESLEK